MKKIMLSLVAVAVMALGAQATESELVYAVCHVDSNPPVEAKVSVVREGIKFTVGEHPMVLEWAQVDLLKRTVEELNK